MQRTEPLLAEFLNKDVTVITCDNTIMEGTLESIDSKTNIVLRQTNKLWVIKGNDVILVTL